MSETTHKCTANELPISYANSVWADEIRRIKKRLRQVMDGVVSSSLRECGMDDFRVIFGCSLPNLKRIAAQTPHVAELADYLWQENIRESKILATMIHPFESFDVTKATLWSSQVSFVEIAEQLAMNLLCRTSFAVDFALDRLHDGVALQQAVGLLTLQRVLITEQRSSIDDKNRIVDGLLFAPVLLDHGSIAELYFNLWRRLLRVLPETNDSMVERIRQDRSIDESLKEKLLAVLLEEMEYI